MQVIAKLRLEISLRVRRLLRHAQNFRSKDPFSAKANKEFNHLVREHRSPLSRNLKGVDPILFKNKKTNLEIAIQGLKGMTIEPGEVFSFWKYAGKPSARRGFLPGLGIQTGRGVASVGGGLCQLSNSLHWLALHSDLKVIERHHHSLDLFPDDARQVPFGTGATLLYNYKDFRLKNLTDNSYRFDFELNDHQLIVKLLASSPLPHRYEVLERDHEFLERAEGLFRKNRIVREKYDLQNLKIAEEELFKNFVKCQYSRGEIK